MRSLPRSTRVAIATLWLRRRTVASFVSRHSHNIGTMTPAYEGAVIALNATNAAFNEVYTQFYGQTRPATLMSWLQSTLLDLRLQFSMAGWRTLPRSTRDVSALLWLRERRAAFANTKALHDHGNGSLEAINACQEWIALNNIFADIARSIQKAQEGPTPMRSAAATRTWLAIVTRAAAQRLAA